MVAFLAFALAGCAAKTEAPAKAASKPTTLSLSVRVSASTKTASMTITNNSSETVIISPQIGFLVVYVVRGEKLKPITYNGWDTDMMPLSALDCVRLTPRDSFSTSRALNLRRSGPLKRGETAVAVLHPLRLGNFDHDSGKLIKRGYLENLLKSKVTSTQVAIAEIGAGTDS